MKHELLGFEKFSLPGITRMFMDGNRCLHYGDPMECGNMSRIGSFASDHPLRRPPLAMDITRTRINLIHPQYKGEWNFHSNWVVERPDFDDTKNADMRLATFFVSKLSRCRREIVRTFKEEVEKCGCHLTYLEHKLQMDTGWENPKETGRLLYFVSYQLHMVSCLCQPIDHHPVPP